MTFGSREAYEDLSFLPPPGGSLWVPPGVNYEENKWAASTTWTDMETLAKQIEERMHGDWSMIREEDLERVWPINEEDREEKIAQFAKKYGFRLRHYVKGICAIFDKWPPKQRT